MLLSKLIDQDLEKDFKIEHLTDDSRSVKAGSVFVCLPDAGEKQKGYIEKAIENGAAYVVSALGYDDERVICVDKPQLTLVRYAKFKFPKQPKTIVGVTGTNGKTSVAWFYNNIMNAAGVKAASIGTLGVYKGDDLLLETGYTSPTALTLHEHLHKLTEDGVETVCLEVSSHALALGRVDGVNFTAGAFTNLSPDHRDFHGTMENYAVAKARLFAELIPDDGSAVLNIQSPASWPMAAMCKQRGLDVLTASSANAELVVKVKESLPTGLNIEIKYEAESESLNVPLVGAFQAENLAIAAGLVLKSGVKWQKLIQGIKAVTSAPGRMEVIAKNGFAPVIVDYAHTPDALETALQALRPQVNNKLWVVFGCGGDRDKAKRPAMGEIARKCANYVVVTDDNPRTENPASIRAQIIEACPEAAECGDRATAIELTLKKADENDVILLAGKGHESGQYINGVAHAFDDRGVTREVLEKLGA